MSVFKLNNLKMYCTSGVLKVNVHYDLRIQQTIFSNNFPRKCYKYHKQNLKIYKLHLNRASG